MSKILAIITARGGSKRIPRKNIRGFFGKAMIEYAIDAAINSKIFNTVMVSTDDKEIAEIANLCGASVPFMRSNETSNDFATTVDVLIEVLNQYKNIGVEFDYLCCIYPCVPFLRSDILSDSYKQFVEQNADALMPVVKFSYPIQRALRINDDDFLEYAYPDYAKLRSQDLETMYHDAGMFYFVKTATLLNEKTLVPNKTITYIMDEREVQDIDTEEDWAMAELKYKITRSKPCSSD